MNKYQIIVLRKLKGFGQFVTESRDETNTYEFEDGDERPVIFGEKLKAVERRTIMRKTREVLSVNCWLSTHKKGADSGISGLCMSCPACVLFGGTYAPKQGGAGGNKNVIAMRRAYYTAAFPFEGSGIRDITFNAVDEKTGQTGQALGTNQVVEPRDFIDVVTVEADEDSWAKLMIWGIEHSDRYGANTRIYGEVHNEILSVIRDTRVRVAAIDLARLPLNGEGDPLAAVRKELKEYQNVSLACSDSDITPLIEKLKQDPAVEDLARRKNLVDISIDSNFEKILAQRSRNWPTEKKKGEKEVKKTMKPSDRIGFLQEADNKLTHYKLAREIEKATASEAEPDADEPATK